MEWVHLGQNGEFMGHLTSHERYMVERWKERTEDVLNERLTILPYTPEEFLAIGFAQVAYVEG